MRSLVDVLDGVRIRPLSSLMAMVLSFGIAVGMAEQADAQASRYTLDDVMGKLIEMDKRLSVVETEVRHNRELIETVNTNLSKQIETVNTNLGDRISDTNTTMFWLFGFLGTLFLGILALTFAVYRNTAGLPKGIFPKEAEKPAEDLAGVLRALEVLQGEVKATAGREKALEEKLHTAGVI